MDELILKWLQGRASRDEERKLHAWVEAAPENRAHLEEVRQVWQVAGRASTPVRSMRRPRGWEVVEQAGGQRLRPSEEQADATPSEGRPRRRSVARWLAPLAAAAGIAGAAIGLQLGGAPDGPTVPFRVAEFTTSANETVTVRLEDGSIVRLGPSTEMRIDGTRGQRDVWLDGQAFFAVARHERAPFVVRTSAGEARVLGTRFDLRAQGGDLRLVVVDGLVRLAAAREEREVAASEMSRVIDGGRLHVSQVSDVYALLEWMEGALIFQATPLARVADELEQRFGIPVEIGDGEVGDRTVTAWFTDEPMEDAVAVICRAADVKCEFSESVVRIGL